MDESFAARYWCHMCSQMVDPLVEVEIKCPLCQSGFIEEMDNGTRENNHGSESDTDFSSDQALSLWAPIFQGMMSSPRRRRRSRRLPFVDDNENGDGGENQPDQDPETFVRRRRRNTSSIFQMLQDMQTERAPELNSSVADRERVVLINPFNQTIVVQGSRDPNHGQFQNPNQTPIGSLGDYFIGPGLDTLLQHLAENDSNRNENPPAKKEAVEAMPTVKIKENVQCSVCLDDFEIGSEGKEMPCKHKFHKGCITPWLELHNSCPVCRYQLPSDESNPETSTTGSGNSIRRTDNGNAEDEDSEGRNGNGRRFSIPWIFNNLFGNGNGNSYSAPSSSSTNTRSRRDDN